MNIRQEAETVPLRSLGAGARTGSPDQVLIVDDDLAARRLLERVALAGGIRPRMAASGTEALESMRRSAPDLVLLDIGLPDMSGLEVLQRMQEEHRWRDIPVVVLTGNHDDALRRKAISMGAVDHLQKPLDLEILKHRINNGLGTRRRQDELEKRIEATRIDRRRANRLLRSVVPEHALDRLLKTGNAQPEHRQDVSVIACQLSEELTPSGSTVLADLERLREVVTRVEDVVRRAGMRICWLGSERFLVLGDREVDARAAASCAMLLSRISGRTEAALRVAANRGSVVEAGLGMGWRTFGCWGPAVESATALLETCQEGRLRLGKGMRDSMER